MSDDFHARLACDADMPFIMSLQRANRESVGGLPAPALRERVARATMMLGLIGGSPMGYIMWDVSPAGLMRIPQACIQYDARRRKYGEALFLSVVMRYPTLAEIRLRCAADVEANLFWRSMGFNCTATIQGGTRRKRLLNVWVMCLEPRLFTVSEIAVSPSAQRREDAMYDDSGFFVDVPHGFTDRGSLGKLAWSNRRAKP